MKQLQMKLLISLLIFTVVIVGFVTFLNRFVLIQNIKEQQQESWELVEDHILSDMRIVDRAHLYLDNINAEQTEQILHQLIVKYEQDQHVLQWDIDAIKAEIGMEFFVIDDNNRIIVSTMEESLNIDFKQCCTQFAELLDERRESGQFYLDGIDSSIASNQLWQYSYLATPDKKYLFELGIRVQDSPLHIAFNFFDTINGLVNKYEDLQEIRIVNNEGRFLDSQDEFKSIDNLSLNLQDAYYKVKKTQNPEQIVVHLEDGKTVTHRFIPYIAESQRGISTTRIIYMKYGNDSELKLLSRNTNQFWLVLIFGICTACILLLIIMRIFMNTIKLATFDTLTGAYNRSSYLNYMDELIHRNDQKYIGLLLIDLDNFKQVNDRFGHLEGDEILIQITKILQQIANKNGYVVRFGGDEFGIVIAAATEYHMQQLAEQIIQKVRSMKMQSDSWQLLSVSIGGAIQVDVKEAEVSLFMRADKALYESKNLGKDRYTFAASVDEITLKHNEMETV